MPTLWPRRSSEKDTSKGERLVGTRGDSHSHSHERERERENERERELEREMAPLCVRPGLARVSTYALEKELAQDSRFVWERMYPEDVEAGPEEGVSAHFLQRLSLAGIDVAREAARDLRRHAQHSGALYDARRVVLWLFSRDTNRS